MLTATPINVWITTDNVGHPAQGTPPVDGIYVDEPWVVMRWDEVDQIVHSEWKAFANSSELRAALLRGIDAIRDHRARGYLTDTRKVKVIIRSDQEWIKETWFPLAIAAGLKRIAVVTATRGLGKVTVEEVVGLGDEQGLISKTFESVEAGRRWIAELPVRA